MAEQNGRPGWIEPSFFKNRPLFPQEELENHAGRYIGWSYDGTHIIDSDEDDGALYDRLKAADYDMGKTLIDYIPTLAEREMSLMGGLMDASCEPAE